jgi:hypothetical protein
MRHGRTVVRHGGRRRHFLDEIRISLPYKQNSEIKGRYLDVGRGRHA